MASRRSYVPSVLLTWIKHQHSALLVLLGDEMEERSKYGYHQLLFHNNRFQLKILNYNSSVNFSDSLSTEPDCNAYKIKTIFI